MAPNIAAVVYGLLIVGLFWLDRERKGRTSACLCFPVLWILIACSRSVSQWLQVGVPIDSSDQVLEGSPLDRNVYMGLVAVGVIVLACRASRLGKLLRGNPAVVVFFLYCLISLVWSDYAEVAFKRWIKALGDFIMVLIVLTDRDPAAAVKRVLVRTSYLLIPLSLLFVKYYPELGKGYGRWDYRAYFTGVTTNKNALGAICLLFGLASVWRFAAALREKQAWQMIAHGVILGMVFWLFWIANSLTSLSSFLLAFPLVLVASRRAFIRRPAALHLLAGSVVAMSLCTLFVVPSLLSTVGRNATLTDRTGIWELALTLTPSPVVGTGFESFWLGRRLDWMWAAYSWHPNQAHNGYLETYLNLGWVGVILLGGVIVSGYRHVLDAVRRKLPTADLAFGYFVVGVVYNCTEAAFFRMTAPIWIFFLMAILKLPRSRSMPQDLAGTGDQRLTQPKPVNSVE
jgi:O-antigen ligase